MKLTPRYYQRNAFNDFCNYIPENPGKHPLIVMPTGSGKSLVQAMIVEWMLSFENTRILLLTHRQELIKQNYIEIVDNLDDQLLDIGIYSAGLGIRNTKNRILLAGIQSVHKKAWELGWFDVILIDEAHRIPHDNIGTYRKFLIDMVTINPNIVIGGLSATPYRMKKGLLCEGKDKLFDDICHNTTIPELINPNHFKNSDHKQYLCEIISKNAANRADLSQVHVHGGEYVQGEMERAFQKDDLVCKAVKEISEYTVDRKKVLIFTAGINHCEEVCEKLNALGLYARFIHSQQSSEINEKNLKDHKDKVYKYLVNVDILTEGYNDKEIDCICMLRGTKSPGLYSQIAGRGLRMFTGKINCLFLDFGGNILLHGPIDKIEIRKAKDGKREVQTAPQKECPNCHGVLHLAVVICPDCGYVFPQKEKHDETASDADILSKWKKPEEIEITKVYYSRHEKLGKPDSLKVEYFVSLYESYNTWVCVQHQGFAKKKADQWIKNVTDKKINSVDEALSACDYFRKPLKIIVNKNGKYPEIIG
jgi:DNA repair protein RadD